MSYAMKVHYLERKLKDILTTEHFNLLPLHIVWSCTFQLATDIWKPYNLGKSSGDILECLVDLSNSGLFTGYKLYC